MFNFVETFLIRSTPKTNFKPKSVGPQFGEKKILKKKRGDNFPNLIFLLSSVEVVLMASRASAYSVLEKSQKSGVSLSKKESGGLAEVWLVCFYVEKIGGPPFGDFLFSKK